MSLPANGSCWWCGGDADSREHKLKRSDLVREFGSPPFNDERTLVRISAGVRSEARGPNSQLFKFEKTLCARCNNERSQPIDRAWDRLTSYLAENENEILNAEALDLEQAFGSDWREEGANASRYLVKHLLCRIVDKLPGPVWMDRPLLDFLGGGAFPACLQLDACLDLGVVAMLSVTRAAPANDPRAAEAGFLNLAPVWVNTDADGHWTDPQSGIHYRWLAIYWRVGDGGPKDPFSQREVELAPSDELLGEDFRELITVTSGLPPGLIESTPDGVESHQHVRDSGYLAEADRLQELQQRISKRQDSE